MDFRFLSSCVKMFLKNKISLNNVFTKKFEISNRIAYKLYYRLGTQYKHIDNSTLSNWWKQIRYFSRNQTLYSRSSESSVFFMSPGYRLFLVFDVVLTIIKQNAPTSYPFYFISHKYYIILLYRPNATLYYF